MNNKIIKLNKIKKNKKNKNKIYIYKKKRI